MPYLGLRCIGVEPASDTIRRHRLRVGLTQADVGLKVGKTEGAVSQWENGRIHPRRDIAYKLDAVLGADGEIIAALGYALPPDGPSVTATHEERISQLEAEVQQLQELVAQLLGRAVKDAQRAPRSSDRAKRAAH